RRQPQVAPPAAPIGGKAQSRCGKKNCAGRVQQQEGRAYARASDPGRYGANHLRVSFKQSQAEAKADMLTFLRRRSSALLPLPANAGRGRESPFTLPPPSPASAPRPCTSGRRLPPSCCPRRG